MFKYRVSITNYMVTKELDKKRTKAVNPLEISEEGVRFSAKIVSFKLDEGTALFEFTTGETDQTYVSTMDATYTMNGRSEFEQFVDENGIEEPEEVFNDPPIDCEVLTEREDDVVKFDIDSVIAEKEDEVTFEEISSFAVGAVAGLAPVSNILFFSMMLVHTMGKEKREPSDVTFLFGTLMSMVASVVVVFPFIF